VLERRTDGAVVILADEPAVVLRGTGVAVWDAFAAPTRVGAAVDALAATYRGDPQVVAREVLPVLEQLRDVRALIELQAGTVTARRFRSLGFEFTLDATDDALRRLLHALFDALATPDEAAPATEVHIESRGNSLVVRVGGDIVCETHDAAFALAHTVWEINRRALEQPDGALLLHAAAVAGPDGAVLLPGRSGSGKSTVAAALVDHHFGYLSDDVVPVDTRTSVVRAYPRPIGLRRDVVPRFAALSTAPASIRRFMGDDWYVTAEMLGGVTADGADDAAIRPRLVVFPSYAPDAANEPVALSRAEALVLLAENAFNFIDLGATGLDVLARVLERCECYRFAFSDLQHVVDFAMSRFATVTPPVGR
jgi:hypothetical protein